MLRTPTSTLSTHAAILTRLLPTQRVVGLMRLHCRFITFYGRRTGIGLNSTNSLLTPTQIRAKGNIVQKDSGRLVSLESSSTVTIDIDVARDFLKNEVDTMSVLMWVDSTHQHDFIFFSLTHVLSYSKIALNCCVVSDPACTRDKLPHTERIPAVEKSKSVLTEPPWKRKP